MFLDEAERLRRARGVAAPQHARVLRELSVDGNVAASEGTTLRDLCARVAAATAPVDPSSHLQRLQSQLS